MNIASILRHSLRLRNSSNLSADVKKQQQIQALDRLLDHVFKHSRFYRSHYERHGIYQRHIGKITITDLPMVDKQMLREHFDHAVCDPKLRLNEIQRFMLDPANHDVPYMGRYSVVHTSGTTGVPGIFAYGPREVALVSAVMFTRINKLQLRPRRARVLMVAAVEGKYGGVAICDHTPKMLYNLKKCSVNLPQSEIRQLAQDFQPTVLGGYASAIHLLALEQLAGRIRINPRSIVCSGEPMTELARLDIKRAFGITPRNFYAASESLALGVECESHGNMHLFDDLHIFECVSDDLREVKCGEAGKMVLTSLYNYTLPLIRYQTSDLIAKSKDLCPCGSTLLKLDALVGRAEEYLWFDADKEQREFIHPITFAELFAPGLERFRVIQTSTRAFRIQAQTKQRAVVSAELSQQLDRILEAKGLSGQVSYSFDFVDRINTTSKSGKFDLVVPYTTTH